MDLDWIVDADDHLRADVSSLITSVVEQHGAVGWLSVPDASEISQWLDSELAAVRAGAAHIAMVRIDGLAAGMGILSLSRAPVLARNAEVRKLMTRPDARGRGVGRVVLLALEDKGRELGLENLLLDVRGNNHAAMALYESAGWLRCGVVPDLIAVGHERFDQVNYVRALQRPPGVVLHGQRPEGPGASDRRNYNTTGP